jgi:hypothetical protein
MNTNTKVIFYTLKDASLYIASLDKTKVVIPGISLNKLDAKKTIVGINHVLKKIHVEYTDISFDWSVYKFVDIDIFQSLDELQTDIYYCVFMPPATLLQKLYWIDIENLLPQYPILRKLLCLI